MNHSEVVSFQGKGLEDLDAQLRRASGFAFYNTSRYDFEKLLGDAPHLAANLRNYIAGFSPNMREVLEKFDFDNTISKLDEAGRLFIETDIRAIEGDIVRMLAEVTGGQVG